MLYIHIPFCKQACHYCDFHFTTNLAQKSAMANAIAMEVEQKKDYLSYKVLDSIYFGGGTPSLLTASELKEIFKAVHSHFTLNLNAEITLEANPDDINEQNLALWQSLGINRLSIGIQSFNDEHLATMNRSHNAKEAKNCIELAKKAGFNKFSVDLIYGIPATNHEILHKDLAQIIALNVDHVSAYCLNIEPKTAFGNWVKKGQMKALDEEFNAEQFEIVNETLAQAGFEAYEISNFAKNEQYAIHNTSYWQGKQYLGIGPSAHSFDGQNRKINIANNTKYTNGILSKQPAEEIEILNIKDRCNELIMTGLRTKWGVDLDKIKTLIGQKFEKTNQDQLEEFTVNGFIKIENNSIFLTPKGKLMADYISSSLFLV